MKRDLDLIREILLAIEKKTDDNFISAQELDITDHTDAEISYHLLLLLDSGYIVAKPLYGDNTVQAWFITRLTSKGCDYLDTVRDPKVWRYTKSMIEKAGGVTLDVVAKIASEVIYKIAVGQLQLP